MMKKEDHINYWKNSAQENWDMALFLIDNKKYPEALFFLNLTVEKLLKANWVRDNFENTPPLTHDLDKIHSDTMLGKEEEWRDFYLVATSWNLETRYPDYKNTLRKLATKAYIDNHLIKIKELRTWLLSRI